MSSLSRDVIKDRIRGCLIGSAVGDAYGVVTEFMTTSAATRVYGNGPIPFGYEPDNSDYGRNDFTDDTDQMLVILQSLEQTRDGRLNPINLSNRLLEWRNHGIPEIGTDPGRGLGLTVGRVIKDPYFRSNPHRAAFEVWDASGRNLAPNGAVMRTAVTGTEAFWDEPRVVENTMAAAKITHADPRSVQSALLSAVLISRLLRGGGSTAEADKAQTWNPRISEPAYRQELLAYLQRGTNLQGEHSLNPAYDEKTDTNRFQPKDYKALEKKYLEDEVRGHKLINSQLQNMGQSRGNVDRSKVTLRTDIGWAGINHVGEDEAMTALARSVMADYKFLLQDTDVASPSGQRQERVQDVWTRDLETHCFPQTLERLTLGESHAIGYTLKCIGIGYFGVTRREDPSPTSPEYHGPSGLFRGLMEQVTLQGGDADTNDAVMGSLLGARFGLERGIPKSWWTGLKHIAWLESTVDAYAERVLANYDAQYTSS
ncbi:hypothetical protein BGZ65_001908 [Modicella reniformis]|uniref:ADP-ribosylglycohydrolase n=1 Tax=Modicella reniformis TaxID=1440133 RepID=A0A9P6LSY4_9FUNG|nr:hypothetical protein BGZ65_001908 [Modicella reniformis]